MTSTNIAATLERGQHVVDIIHGAEILRGSRADVY